MQPFRLLRFRNRIELELLLSLFVNRLRTVLAVKGPPRRNGAPLTAPGRSEETIPHKRERRVGKLNDPAFKHLATSPARPRTRYYASRHLHSGRGAGCRNFSRLPARGGAFSLDILFYRTKSARLFGEGEKPGRAARPSCQFRLFRRHRHHDAVHAASVPVCADGGAAVAG